MALRSALRYALAGATGAAEGYGAKQQRLQQEEQRRLAQERQARLDQLDLEEKTASLLSSGFMPEEEAVSRQQAARSAIGSAIGSALASAEGRVLAPPSEEGLRRAAEGAAGYNTARRTSFGGQTFVLPETAAERTERTKRTDAMMEQQRTENERRRLVALAQAAKKGGRGSKEFAELLVTDPRAAEALLPTPRQTDLGDIMRMREYEDEQRMIRDEAEAWWNSLAGTRDPEAYAATSVFNKLRKANPKAPARDLILAAYRQMASRVGREATAALGEQRAAAAAKTSRTTTRVPSALPPGMANPMAPPAGKPPAAPPAGPVNPAEDFNDLQSAFNQFNK